MMNTRSPKPLMIARTAALISYFALFALLMNWYTWLAPSATLPVFWMLVFFVGPLLFPLRGLIRGKGKSYAWLLYLSLFYFIHGAGEIYSDSGTRMLSGLEIFLSCILYLSALFTIRLSAKQTQPNT